MDCQYCYWYGWVALGEEALEVAREEDVCEFGVGVSVSFGFPGVREGGVYGGEGVVARVWDPAVGYGRYLVNS